MHERIQMAGRRWLTPVILATPEAGYQEDSIQNKGPGGVAQGVGPKFKLQCPKKKKESR
jgi:hypothetical protein